jgi:hypothetical protein
MLKYPSTNPVPEFNRSVDIAGLTKGVSKYKNPTGKVYIFNLLCRTYLQELTACKIHLFLSASQSLSSTTKECFLLQLKSVMVLSKL